MFGTEPITADGARINVCMASTARCFSPKRQQLPSSDTIGSKASPECTLKTFCTCTQILHELWALYNICYVLRNPRLVHYIKHLSLLIQTSWRADKKDSRKKQRFGISGSSCTFMASWNLGMMEVWSSYCAYSNLFPIASWLRSQSAIAGVSKNNPGAFSVGIMRHFDVAQEWAGSRRAYP